jgi:hypothetical protein
MKKISILFFAGIIILLVSMLLSCVAQEKAQTQSQAVAAVAPETAKPAEAVPSKLAEAAPVEEKKTVAEAQPAAAQFLADKHKTSGVSCADCHNESISKEPATDVCMTCHQDYRDKATSSIDPHNAHMSYANCGDCHHGHKTSENQCLSCHSFASNTP